jgi:hypothetical protein
LKCSQYPHCLWPDASFLPGGFHRDKFMMRNRMKRIE